MKIKRQYMPSMRGVIFGLVLLIILVLLEIDIRDYRDSLTVEVG